MTTLPVPIRSSLFISLCGVLLLLLTACQNANARMQAQAEQYFRGNIAQLSPRAPELGGRFQVTAVQWVDDDTALVSYEDGHIALKARADVMLDTTRDQIIVSRFQLEAGSQGSTNTSSSSHTSSSVSSHSSVSSASSASSISSSLSTMSSSAASARDRAGVGEFCGGIAGILCEDGLTCDYDGTYPDAGGTCVNS